MNEQCTFYQYAKQYITYIPIIQRDYAQGRKGQKEQLILERFLKDIKNSLNNKKPLSLNFIYGIIETDGRFLPIDGQQRLTTLYLLHWFTALKCNKLEDFINDKISLTYQTRSSAIEFFEIIQSKENLHEIYNLNNGNLLRNYSWFRNDWNYDSTINSVIETIDKMFIIFNDIDYSEWWTMLISPDCPITFQYIPINNSTNEIKINDFENESRAASTYIKMNARGKPLSDFENIKALFHGLGKSGKLFAENYDKKYIRLIEEIIGQKIKTKSINILTNSMDDAMIKLLINLYNDLNYLIHKDEQKGDLIKNYYDFLEQLRNFENIENLEKNNILIDYFSIIDIIFSTPLYLLPEFYSYCMDYDRPQRLKFCALIFYVWRCTYNKNNIDEWIYVLNNFHYFDDDNIRNDRSTDRYSIALPAMHILAEDIGKSDNKSPIYFISKISEYLPFEKVYSIEKSDWKEQHIKSKIITEKKLMFNYFMTVEELFNKRIRLFLYMSGFWNDNGDKEYLDNYIDIAKSFELKYSNDPGMSIKKLFFLLSTGYDDLNPIKGRPYIESSIYSLSDENNEKVDHFKLLFNYLIRNHISTIDELNYHLFAIANSLYKDKDWRSLVLRRNYEELFYHNKNGHLINTYGNDNGFIPILVKKLDTKGIDTSTGIVYIQKSNIGNIGKYYNKSISFEVDVTINITVNGQFLNENTFYTNYKSEFKIFRYNGFTDEKHNFNVKEFDIINIINKYNDISIQIKELLYNLPNEEKQSAIENRYFDGLLKKCLNLIPVDDCELCIESYYYTIIAKIFATISVDIDDNEYISSDISYLDLDSE